MKKFVIEREIPGAGNFTQEEFDQITEKSCSVLKDMGPRIEWLESYVTDDKIYCVYLAPDAPEPLSVAAVEPVAVEPAPEPVAYVVGENYPAGAVVEWDDRLLAVTKGHQATDAWNPDTKPDWFEEV